MFLVMIEKTILHNEGTVYWTSWWKVRRLSGQKSTHESRSLQVRWRAKFFYLDYHCIWKSKRSSPPSWTSAHMQPRSMILSHIGIKVDEIKDNNYLDTVCIVLKSKPQSETKVVLIKFWNLTVFVKGKVILLQILQNLSVSRK